MVRTNTADVGSYETGRLPRCARLVTSPCTPFSGTPPSHPPSRQPQDKKIELTSLHRSRYCLPVRKWHGKRRVTEEQYREYFPGSLQWLQDKGKVFFLAKSEVGWGDIKDSKHKPVQFLTQTAPGHLIYTNLKWQGTKWFRLHELNYVITSNLSIELLRSLCFGRLALKNFPWSLQ